MIAAFGASAAWDTSIPGTKAFNVNDISGLADATMLFPRPWLPVAIDVSQAVGANQPLGVGTPQYGRYVSIQFTAANADRLAMAGNLIGAVPATMLGVWRFPNTTGNYFFLSNCSAGGGSGWSLGIRAGAGGRDTVAAGVSARTDGVPGTAAPEVWICRDWAAAAPPADMMVDGIMRAVSAATAIRTTPGAGNVTLGSLDGATLPSDVDFCLGAIFPYALSDGLAVRLSFALSAP